MLPVLNTTVFREVDNQALSVRLCPWVEPPGQKINEFSGEKRAEQRNTYETEEEESGNHERWLTSLSGMSHAYADNQKIQENQK